MPTTPTPDAPSATATVHRVEVRARPGFDDPVGQAVRAEAHDDLPGLTAVRPARVYLIAAPLNPDQLRRIAEELLADPVSQAATIGVSDPADAAESSVPGPADAGPAPTAVIEVHYLPGVMDPVAQSTRDAIVEMLPELAALDRAQDGQAVEVRTGMRYDLVFDTPAALPDAEALRRFAATHLANPVVQAIHLQPVEPEAFAHGHPYRFELIRVPIRHLDDAALTRLSRDGHLFLSLDEMRTIQRFYRDAGREPTDIEIETLAQTWSEHCVHKTLKSTIHYRPAGADDVLSFADRPGHELHDDGSVTIHNLLKSTIAAATFRLMDEDPAIRDWCVSVFEDNAGIVKLDDRDGVCIKVETHNHPSAIEPYGGAATGIGGCIRDVMGTGLFALPVANTNAFFVAEPGATELPRGVIAPARVLRQVVAGVRDYGNRMGIPTVSGMVCFDPDFLGNPLVFAGCVGLLPLDKCFGTARPGDRIIALGGATGRDGIHGATFSSAELTDTHSDEFAHAVQIGNPITQKRVLDVILQARDHPGGTLFSAITDCGAGGFSSAIGEMGEKVGATVELDRAPLKYAGLSYTEVWISEAQERMVLAVPPEQLDRLAGLCDAEGVSWCDLGAFGRFADEAVQTGPELVLRYRDHEVGRLPMALLHEGIPTPVREAVWPPADTPAAPPPVAPSGDEPKVSDALLDLLAHPNIASKHWIIRQYDHEVQGGSVVKPLVGPEHDGPSDAAVVRPKLDSARGIALACGAAPHLAEKSRARGLTTDGDAYLAALAAIDEAVRNAVCVGADPDRIAILDNFCWPGCDDPGQLGSLVRAAEACYDGALAYRCPFISGKDSLNNQFITDDGRRITIPQTLLITALGIVPDVSRCVTMDLKADGSALVIVGPTHDAMGGSHLRMLHPQAGGTARTPRVGLAAGPAHARAVASLIGAQLVRSAHDCSDGGLLVAAAEMAFGGRMGVDLDLAALPTSRELDPLTAAFAETPSRYLLEVAPGSVDAVVRRLSEAGVPFGQVGVVRNHGRLTLRTPRRGRLVDLSIEQLRRTWQAPLDW